MSAAPLPPLWAFPLEGGCVSKPPLPTVHTVDAPYELRGISTGASVAEARFFCCWIEASTHALLVDPYLRWFLEDYNNRFELSGTKWICANPFAAAADPLHLRYEDGVQVMAYFAARLRHDVALEWTWNATMDDEKKAQKDFDDAMEPLLQTFRAYFSPPGSALDLGNNMGDVGSALTRLLPGVRLFVAYNWSGNEFQRQFVAYGCKPISACVRRCAGTDKDKCSFYGIESEYFDDDSVKKPAFLSAPQSIPHEGYSLLDMTDLSATQYVRLVTGTHRLEDVLKDIESWTGCWAVANGKECRAYNGNRGCDQLHIVQKKLVTLPFMLHFLTYRANQSNLMSAEQLRRMTPEQRARLLRNVQPPYELLYDPEKLVVGPTRDNHYATYQLACRVEYRGAHFVADVRMADGTFTQYNFHHQTRNQRIPQKDTSCAYLVWRRVDNQ